jgi:hypothetical protein
MDKFQEMLCGGENDVSRCKNERSTVLCQQASIGIQSSCFRHGNKDILNSSVDFVTAAMDGESTWSPDM